MRKVSGCGRECEIKSPISVDLLLRSFYIGRYISSETIFGL